MTLNAENRPGATGGPREDSAAGGIAATVTQAPPPRVHERLETRSPHAADSARPPDSQCGHWLGAESRHCRKAQGIRRYLTGFRCPDHTPAAVQRGPETAPSAGWHSPGGVQG